MQEEGRMLPIAAQSMAFLTQLEVRKLTLYKWLYALEAQGFTKPEAERILFLRWLYTTRYSRV